jgi:hypothetical protein
MMEAEDRDAVIWVSGLAESAVSQSPDATAARIAAVLESNTPARLAFSISTAAKTPAGELTIPICTIVRTDGESAQPIIDVFGFAVEERLVGPVRDLPLWKQVFLGGGIVVAAILVLIPKLRSSTGKSPRERWQVFYAFLLLAVMALALISLLGLLAATLTKNDLTALPRWLAAAILAFGGLSLWSWPPVKQMRASGLALYAAYRYVEHADDSGASLRGQLAKALDSAQNQEGVTYKRIVVVAYSFGSLVALDACLSPTAPTPARFVDIDELVTIGCPFDFIRTFRPDYAGPRHARAGAPGRWTNVYAPSDVLSSNFRDDALPAAPEVPIALREPPGARLEDENLVYRIDGRDAPVSIFGTLLLKGLRFHGRYWSDSDPDAESVFAVIVPRLFPQP